MSTSHHNEHDESIFNGIPRTSFEDAFAEQLEKLRGTYPDDKIHATDEGATAFKIGEHDGRLILEFATPVKWLGFDPNAAIRLGQRIDEYLQCCGPIQSGM